MKTGILLVFVGAAILVVVAHLVMTKMNPPQNPYEAFQSANVSPNTGSGQGAQNTPITGLPYFEGPGTALGAIASSPAGFAPGGVSPSTATPIGSSTGSLGGWY